MTTPKEALEAAAKALASRGLSWAMEGESVLFPGEIASIVVRTLEAAGWQCVPKEADENILDAFVCDFHAKDDWELALAAAPKLTEVK